MLNQERVCEMTKLAIFDQKDGREYKPMIQYFRKDYVAKELLKSFITGTAAFFIIAAVLCLYHIEELMDQLNHLDIPKLAVRGVLAYAGYLAVYLLITYVVYNMRYTSGRREVKKYYIHLKRVNRIYHDEEQL